MKSRRTPFPDALAARMGENLWYTGGSSSAGCDGVAVPAHRENTLSSLHAAAAAGARWVEFDGE